MTRRARIKIFYIIFFTISLQFLFSPYSYSQDQIKVKPAPNTIALTFDDGPDPRFTPAILSILKKYDIKATFFVMGSKALKNPELIKQIHQDGHVIANHTMTHPMLPRISPEKMHYEITKTNEIIHKIIGVKPRCLRPPFGMHNRAIDDFVHTLNMAVVTWDLNSFDYAGKGKDTLVHWVLAKSGPRFDILMHDGSGNSYQTVAALPEIIQGFQRRGFGFDVICTY